MFEALVIVTREGVEAALVVAIVLAYLTKTGRGALRPWVFAGVGVALVLSALGAWLLPGWIAREVVNEEAVEGWLLLAAGVCVATLVVWLVRSGKHMKAEIDRGLQQIGGTGRHFAWGVALFVTLLLVREGLETILFLTAISFNTDGVQRLAGALGGLVLSVAFGVLVTRGALAVHLKKFFAATTAILVVLGVQLFVGAYHEFAEAGLVPANRTSMAVVGPIVRYDSLLFAAAILITFLLVLRPAVPAPPAAAAANPAERRLAESRRRAGERLGQGAAVATIAVLAVLLTGFVSQARVPARVPGEALPLAEGAVRVPTAGLADGPVRFYHVAVAGRAVRFFVAERPDGSPVACLDACLICGDIGYYEDAAGMTCRNCTAPINPASLGIGGGCNPIPLASSVEDGALVVREEALAASAHYFPAAP